MADRFTRKCIVCGEEVKPAKFRHTPLPMTRHEFECFKKRPDLIPNHRLKFIYERRLQIEAREENLKRLSRVRARTRGPKKITAIALFLLGSVINFNTIPEAHGQLAAGTHQAQYVQPYWPKDPDYKAFIIPAQDMYGYYGGQYGMPGRAYPNYGSRWQGYGWGYYHGDMSGPDYGRDMSPEEYYSRRSRRYQYRGQYNNPPWFGYRW